MSDNIFSLTEVDGGMSNARFRTWYHNTTVSLGLAQHHREIVFDKLLKHYAKEEYAEVMKEYRRRLAYLIFGPNVNGKPITQELILEVKTSINAVHDQLLRRLPYLKRHRPNWDVIVNPIRPDRLMAIFSKPYDETTELRLIPAQPIYYIFPLGCEKFMELLEELTEQGIYVKRKFLNHDGYSMMAQADGSIKLLNSDGSTVTDYHTVYKLLSSIDQKLNPFGD